jgi:RNA polymerase sigma-70 factor (ECF subfamily)
MSSICLMPAELTRVVPADASISVEQIYRTHAIDVTRWVSRLAGPGVDLEDLVQEVFLRVQRYLPTYRGEALLTTWLFQIASNVVRHHRRRERWRSLLGRSHDARDGTTREPEVSPDDQVAKSEARRLVYRALDRLKERYRTAIVLFEIEDLPGEKVAELLGITSANLWVLLHRARAELVKQVEAIREEEL